MTGKNYLKNYIRYSALFLAVFITTLCGAPGEARASVQVQTSSFIGSASAGTTQSVTNVGFRPRALIFFSATSSANSSFSGDLNWSMGFAASSSATITNRTLGFSSEGAADADAYNYVSSTRAILLMDGLTGAVKNAARVTSFDSAGFTLTWDAAASPYIHHYIALGGDDITHATTGQFTMNPGTGSVSVTGIGFRPDFIMLIGAGSSTNANESAATAGAPFSLGIAASSTQGPIEQAGWGIMTGDADGSGRGDSCRAQSATSAIVVAGDGAAICSTATVDALASITSFDTDGFTYNKSNAPVTGRKFFYLAIKGGDHQVGSDAAPTSAGSSTVIGVGHTPIQTFLTTWGVAEGAVQAHSAFGIGAATSTSAGESIAYFDENDDTAPDPDVKAVTSSTDALLHFYESNGTIGATSSLESFTDDGFNLNWINPPAVATQFLFWTVGHNKKLTAVATGTQTTSLPTGTSNNHIGGAFIFTTNTSSTNVSQITINEEGTVDANANLSNLDLYYELDATSACSYDGNETLYGTDTAFDATDIAVVTGSMTVGSTPVCVYPVLDIGSGASVGQTIELEISNPMSHISVGAGATSSPATVVAITGSTTLVAAVVTFDQVHYRWRDSVAVETSAESAWTTSTLDNVSSTGRLALAGIPNTAILYAAYAELGVDKIIFASSSNGGNTWVTSTVTNASTGVYTINMKALSTSSIYIVYGNSAFGGLFFASTSNGGATWVSSTISGTGVVDNQILGLEVLSPSTIYVGYNNENTGAILFASSSNSGVTWTTSTVTASPTSSSYTSMVARSPSHIYYTYRDTARQEFTFASSGDSGVTWTTSTIAAHPTSDFGAGSMLISPATNTIYAVYLDITQDDVIFASSSNEGATWTTSTIDASPTSLITTQNTFIYALSTSTIYVTYKKDSYLFFASSTNGGATWSTTTIDLTSSLTVDNYIAAPSGTSSIYALYQDSGIDDFLFARYTANTFPTAEDTELTNLGRGSSTRIRFEISNEGNASASSTYLLEYQENATSGAWTAVPASVSSEHWELVDSPYSDDGQATQNITTAGSQALTDANPTFVAGEIRDRRATTSAITLSSTQFTELEYSIRATSTASYSGVYYFRLTNNGTTTNFLYTKYAKVTLGAAPPTSTIIEDGTDPANVTIGPGGASTTVDAFAFRTSAQTDSITQVTVTLASSVTSSISKVDITNASGSIVYGSTTNPTANSFSITLNTPIVASSTSVTYLIRVTPKSHVNMPSSSVGQTYSVTAQLVNWSGTFATSGSDTVSTTVTIDNLATNPTGATGATGVSLVTLDWTNSSDSDYTTTTVFRATSAIGDTAPTEGTSYATGTAVSATTTVACVVGGSAGSAVTCVDTDVTAGTAYHYKIFTQDSYGNHSTGTVPSGSPVTPVAPSVDFQQIHYRFRNDDGGEASTTFGWTSSTVDSGDGLNWDTNIVTPSGDGLIYATYAYDGQDDIILATSTDGGTTWTTSTIARDGNTGGGAIYNSLAVPDSNTFYAVYTGASAKLKFARSTDAGRTWASSSLDGIGGYPTILTPSGTSTVYISYLDTTAKDVRFAKSTDGGTTWTTSTIDANSDTTGEPSMTIPSGASSTIYISYEAGSANGLAFAKSTNGGTSWTTSSIDSTFSTGNFSAITAPTTSTIFVSYIHNNDTDLDFAKSTNGGTTWSTSSIYDTVSQAPTAIIAPSTSTVYIAYMQSSKLLFASSTDGGSTFTTSTVALNSLGDYPTLVTPSGNSPIYLAYHGGVGGDSFVLAKYNDATSTGASFAAAEDTELTGLAVGTTTRIRFEISNEGNTSASSTFRLEYQQNSTSGAWTAVPATATSQDWELSDSTYITDGDTTQNITASGSQALTDANASFKTGELRDARATTSAISLNSTQFTEIEYAIRATSSAPEGGVYYFRLTNNGTTTNHSYVVYPKVTIGQPNLTQSHYRWRNDSGVEDGWTTSTIDSGSAAGLYNAITAPIGASSTIYISYQDSGQRDLIFAKSEDEGVTWTTSTIDTNASSGYWTSITAPTTSTIYVSYSEDTTDDLFFAKSTNGGVTWTSSSLDTFGIHSGIVAPDGTSTIYIVYEGALGYLRLATSTDGGDTWSTSTVLDFTGGGSNNYISLTTVGTSTLYASYFVEAAWNDLRIAMSTNGGVTWATSTLDTAGSTGLYNSIDAPTTSTIFISYYNTTLDDLFFAKSTDGGTIWTTSTIDAPPSAGVYTSIAAPTTSTIYISYSGTSPTDLFLANSSNGGVSWTTSTLDNGVNAGLYSAILNPEGTSNVYIAYYRSQLGFAKSTSGGDTDFAAAEDTELTGLAKSSTTRLRFEISNEGSLVDSSTFRLEYQENATSGTWTSVPATASSEHWELSDSSYITDGEATQNITYLGTQALTDSNATFVAGELRDARSTTSMITLTSTDFTEIEYSIRATTTATDSGVYYFRLTNNGTTTNHSYSVYPKVTLAGQSMTQAHYRWRNNTGGEAAWTTSTVDIATGGVGVDATAIFNSIVAPSGTDTIYISYSESDRDDLLFAKSLDAGITWATSTIDANASSGFYVSMTAPAGTSTIYISYYEDTQENLLFAKSVNGGTTWTTSTIDAGGSTGFETSIVAPSGTSTIYVSYYQSTNTALLFAKSTDGGTTWATTTVDTNSATGRYSSISAPSGTSTIYISYQEDTRNHLLFAKSTDGGTTWTTSTIDGANGIITTGAWTAIVAPAGTSTIYISYNEFGFDDLKFAKSVNGGTTWTTSTVDSGGTINSYSSIIAPSGTSTIYISYYEANRDDILFAKSLDGGTTWATSTIDAGGGSGPYNSMVAPSGTSTVYVSYYEFNQDNLMFAKTTTGGDTDFAAPEDTELTGLAKSSTTRLRVEISNEGSVTDSSTFRLEYQENATSGAWTAVPASASSEHWEMSASSYITDGEATQNITSGGTQALTDANTTFVAGELRDAQATTSLITLTSTQFTELEYSIRATTDATDSGVYYFRLTNNGATTNFAYLVYPKVTLGAGTSSTLALSNHPQGQASNQFDITPSVVTDTVLFRYRLTPSANMSITTTTVQITNYSGFVEGNLTNFRLYHDVDNDGVLDADEPARHATGTVTLYTSTGTIVFGTAWTATTTSDIILIGTVASINDSDFITLSVSYSDILATGATVSGSAQSINHFKPTRTVGGNAPATETPPAGVEQGGGDEGGVGNDDPGGGSGEQGGGGTGGGGGSGGAPMMYCIFFPESSFCEGLRSEILNTENEFRKFLIWLLL